MRARLNTDLQLLYPKEQGQGDLPGSPGPGSTSAVRPMAWTGRLMGSERTRVRSWLNVQIR